MSKPLNDIICKYVRMHDEMRQDTVNFNSDVGA